MAALRTTRPGDERHEAAPFFARQVRIVTERSGLVDPESLEDAVAHGGYEALRQVLATRTPAEVRDEITASGLRGRGGAGYPTGLKWNTVAKAPGASKVVICNADEGDPGAFMDRSVLESDPHRVLEGMAIAAYAVGASSGYVYCRAEYPLAVAAAAQGDPRGREAWLPRPVRAGLPVLVRGRCPAGRRRVRVRRGDRADRVDRGGPRDAAAPPAVPGRVRPARPARR